MPACLRARGGRPKTSSSLLKSVLACPSHHPADFNTSSSHHLSTAHSCSRSPHYSYTSFSYSNCPPRNLCSLLLTLLLSRHLISVPPALDKTFSTVPSVHPSPCAPLRLPKSSLQFTTYHIQHAAFGFYKPISIGPEPARSSWLAAQPKFPRPSPFASPTLDFQVSF